MVSTGIVDFMVRIGFRVDCRDIMNYFLTSINPTRTWAAKTEVERFVAKAYTPSSLSPSSSPTARVP